jgi:hypothetical protein
VVVLEYWSNGVVASMKSQISSTKLQTNFKFQYSMTKTRNRSRILKLGPRPQGGESKRSADNFGHCDLFDICNLLFVIFNHSSTPADCPTRGKTIEDPSGGSPKPGLLCPDSLLRDMLIWVNESVCFPVYHPSPARAVCQSRPICPGPLAPVFQVLRLQR